jgi:threonyl-tRNA synthetase
MLLAKKFGMEYVDVDGKMKTPYIIHRTSIGCYERTLALLIEKYAGVLPLWLAPEQVRVLPINENHLAYAQAIADKLDSCGMRVTVDKRDDNIGPKIKAARFDRIPYMLIVGDKEKENNTVTVRSRKEGELPDMPLDELVSKLVTEVATKAK